HEVAPVEYAAGLRSAPTLVEQVGGDVAEDDPTRRPHAVERAEAAQRGARSDVEHGVAFGDRGPVEHAVAVDSQHVGGSLARPRVASVAAAEHPPGPAVLARRHRFTVAARRKWPRPSPPGPLRFLRKAQMGTSTAARS